jgi:hypothetical protein
MSQLVALCERVLRSDSCPLSAEKLNWRIRHSITYDLRFSSPAQIISQPMSAFQICSNLKLPRHTSTLHKCEAPRVRLTQLLRCNFGTWHATLFGGGVLWCSNLLSRRAIYPMGDICDLPSSPESAIEIDEICRDLRVAVGKVIFALQQLGLCRGDIQEVGRTLRVTLPLKASYYVSENLRKSFSGM